MLSRVLFPLLVLLVLTTQAPRHCALFLWSITFQTNLMGWVSLWPGAPLVIQMLGCCYLVTVAILWFLFLGGKEASWTEHGFNVLIHYVTCVPVVWNANPKRWPSRWWLCIYPVLYWAQMSLMNRWAGWEIYPVNIWTSCAAAGVLVMSPYIVAGLHRNL